MKRSVLQRGRSIGRALLARPGSTAVILAYHRVANLGHDPWGISVTPRSFAEHVDVLRQHRVVPLAELPAAAAGGAQRGGRVVAVTFDDGYRDNVDVAAPLLEQSTVPATFFLVAAQLEHGDGFWWDELADIVLGPSELPPAVDLWVAGGPVRAPASARGPSRRESPRGRRRVWEARPGSRLALYHTLWLRLQPLDDRGRRAALADLRDSVEGAAAGVNGTTMTRDDAVTLARQPLFELGSHGLTHATLPRHEVAVQKAEVRQSRVLLEDIVDAPITSFAFPYGDFDAVTCAAVRECYERACTSLRSAVTAHTDPFELPRFQVPDCSGAQLDRRLWYWSRTVLG